MRQCTKESPHVFCELQIALQEASAVIERKDTLSGHAIVYRLLRLVITRSIVDRFIRLILDLATTSESSVEEFNFLYGETLQSEQNADVYSCRDSKR